MTTTLTPLAIPAGPDALAALPHLEAALAGSGPLAPHSPDGAAPHYPAPTHPGPTTARADLPADLALVVGTSGSTGDPKRAMLTGRALLASAAATHDRLGGPGQWLLALPGHHIAGLQVLVRSLVAGTTPVAVTPDASGFDLVQATAAMSGERRYLSLVPTQLRRLMADPLGAQALARFDAVLVGGAVSDPRLVDGARSHGVRVVTTYGMSETAGGCVYNGAPLAGVTVEVDASGRLVIAGPMLAEGYLDASPADHAAFALEQGRRVFRTNDLGAVDEKGRVDVHGRADDLITSGGLKVSPRVVEEAVLASIPAITEVVVIATPDPEWGEAVTVVAVTSPGGPPLGAVPREGVDEIRAMLRDRLPGHALPRVVHVVAALPTLGPGKIDRAAAARLVSGIA